MDQSSPFSSARPVFVTGCTGFLGSWVVRELLDRGAAVVGLVRDRVPDSDFLRDRLFEQMRIVRGRIEDRGRLIQALAIHEAAVVFHLAGPPADALDREAIRANWLNVVSTAARLARTPTVVVPVRPGEAISFAGKPRPLVLPVPIPTRTPGPDAACLLVSAAERLIAPSVRAAA